MLEAAPLSFAILQYLAILPPEVFVKNNCYSSLVVTAICSEFHKEDTSSSAVLASSGLSLLWNFDQVIQKVAFIFLP